MIDNTAPLGSLQRGNWFKLICGASFQDLPSIRSLAIAYSLAGADCIDLAADPVVIQAAQAGIEQAQLLAAQRAGGIYQVPRPLIMVSLTVGADPHFRKARFDPQACPVDCPRPCQRVCPTEAIAFATESTGFSGVLDQRCYGCGRCLSLCPFGLIKTDDYITSVETITPAIQKLGIDAIEVHTQVGPLEPFLSLWQALTPWLPNLKLIAISCGDRPGLVDYLRAIAEVITPLPCPLIWQTDGRPMSGDIGRGTTHRAITLGQKVLQAQLPGYVQLAGGTNENTVPQLRRLGLLNEVVHSPLLTDRVTQWSNAETYPSKQITGVAYGSYARKLIAPTLNTLEIFNQHRLYQGQQPWTLEQQPSLLWQAVEQAQTLVAQLKPLNPKVDAPLPPTNIPAPCCPVR